MRHALRVARVTLPGRSQAHCRIRGRQPSERIAPGVRAYLAASRRPAGGRCRSWPRWTATASSPAPGPWRGARWTWCSPSRAWRSGARCCCTTIPSGRLDPVRRRSRRRGAAARWRRRLRHHRQRRDRALRRRRGAARPRGAPDRSVRRDRHAGRARPRGARSSASTRTGRASATWPPTSPTATTTAASLLLEAGTGVGKSFAYLVPALAWARANGERTVVSTNTINLQEQLVGKDLPLLRRALGDRRLHADVRAAQGLAELSLPRAAAAGGRLAADAARAGQARRAARHRRVGRPHRRTAR